MWNNRSYIRLVFHFKKEGPALCRHSGSSRCVHPRCSAFNPIPVKALERAVGDVPSGRPGWSTRFLVSAWSSLGSCSHLGERANRWKISLSLPLALSNKQIYVYILMEGYFDTLHGGSTLGILNKTFQIRQILYNSTYLMDLKQSNAQKQTSWQLPGERGREEQGGSFCWTSPQPQACRASGFGNLMHSNMATPH